MKNSNDIVKANIVTIGRKIGKNTKTREQDTYMGELLSLLFFANAQALSIIFRRNFGAKGINKLSLAIAFLFFAIVSIVLLYQFYHPANIDFIYGSRGSYFVTAIILAVLAIFFLIKGILDIAKAKEDSDHPGDSFLLGFLTKQKRKQKIIQFFAEPFCMLLIGCAYCFYNLWGGCLLAFCGLSVWGSMAVEYFYLGNRVQNGLNGMSSNSDDNLSRLS